MIHHDLLYSASGRLLGSKFRFERPYEAVADSQPLVSREES